MTVHKTFQKFIVTILLACTIITMCGCGKQKDTKVNNSPYIEYTDADTNNNVFYDDEASLISDAEKTSLISDMTKLTKYYDVIFLTVKDNSYHNTEKYVKYFIKENEYIDESSSALVFVIDMDMRSIDIYGTNKARDFAFNNGSYITERYYQEATDGEYYKCVSNVFANIIHDEKLWDKAGNNTTETEKSQMQQISTILLAIMLAFAINYIIIMKTSAAVTAPNKQIISAITAHCNISNISSSQFFDLNNKKEEK